MTQTVTRLFDNYDDAKAAVREIESLGVPHGDVSIMADKNNDAEFAGRDPDSVNHAGDVSRGVGTGAAIGGVGGLLAGMGLLIIPGLGPIVAAGWLATTLAGIGAGAAGGALTGTIVGALTEAGHTDEEAQVYAEGLRRGGTLVSVRAPDDLVDRVESVLQRNRSVTASDRGSAYRDGGWAGFDDTAPAFTAAERENERTRYASTRAESLI